MSTKPTKTGRPRRYELTAPEGFAHRELALGTALLQELAERVYDQVEDLPREALDFTPGDSRLSIGWLVLHMAWAEGRMIGLATGAEVPADLAAGFQTARLDHYGEPPPPSEEPAALIERCRRMQREFTLPALRPLTDIDRPLERGGLKLTLRGVIQQLNWHWSYHSGQIGLIRLLWGSEYTWTTENLLAPGPGL